MYTYSDFLQDLSDVGCWMCSCLVDDEERPIYCNNNGHSFCYRVLYDIMLDCYVQVTGAVFAPCNDFLDGSGEE